MRLELFIKMTVRKGDRECARRGGRASLFIYSLDEQNLPQRKTQLCWWLCSCCWNGNPIVLQLLIIAHNVIVFVE